MTQSMTIRGLSQWITFADIRVHTHLYEHARAHTHNLLPVCNSHNHNFVLRIIVNHCVYIYLMYVSETSLCGSSSALLFQDVTVVVGDPVDYTELLTELKGQQLSVASLHPCSFYLSKWKVDWLYSLLVSYVRMGSVNITIYCKASNAGFFLFVTI